jgi:hypothetical protein
MPTVVPIGTERAREWPDATAATRAAEDPASTPVTTAIIPATVRNRCQRSALNPSARSCCSDSVRSSPAPARGRGSSRAAARCGARSRAQAVKVLVPPPPLAESVDNLADACSIYAALGVGSIREALLLPEGWEVYQSAWEQGRLTIRCLPLLLVDSSHPQEQRLAFVEGLGARSGFGDD